jgi:uncharacterized protein (DUF2252 family)
MHAALSQSEARRPHTRRIIPTVIRTSHAELYAKGEKLRKKCPRSSHAEWKPKRGRVNPVQLVEQGNEGRIPELIPIRHGRMMYSPFTFYRGTALIMAADLANTASTGLRVQACGDAHLGNFRCFATPERRIIFDIHDLDETLPAPWEWDVKRLAASFVVASRNNGLRDSDGEAAALACVRKYREQMHEFSRMNALEVWYASFEAEALIENMDCKQSRKRVKKTLRKARERSAFEHDFPKLAHTKGGLPAIKEHRPTIYHWHGHGRDEASIRGAFDHYRNTLRTDRRTLLDRYKLHDVAIKVVGVGSVGTVCFIALLMAEEKDPLFLQIKEARASVLEAYTGASVFANHGERVVTGHRLMQSASDIFLGWTVGFGKRDFYVRQLRDAKIKFEVERFDAQQMLYFAECCGLTLARAHARSGEPAAISGYLGNSSAFDEAIAAFSVAYADQAERDYEAFRKAVLSGRLPAASEAEN